MLRSLGDPFSLLVLAAAFVLAAVVHSGTQRLVAGRVRGAGGLRPAAGTRSLLDPRAHLDPFGAVAGLISGTGWGATVPAPDRRRRGTLIAVLLSGPVAVLVLGVLLLVAFRVTAQTGGSGGGSPGGYVVLLQEGAGDSLGYGARALLLTGVSLLFFGALALVPLPPLPGGRLLLGLGPTTPGWQRADYQLSERNIGVAVLLALLLIPLGGPQPLLPGLLDTLLSPLIDLVILG